MAAAEVDGARRLFEAQVMVMVEFFHGSCLTAEQMGLALGVDAETVKRLHRTPPHKLRGFTVGKELRWRAEDVQRFIDRSAEVGE